MKAQFVRGMEPKRALGVGQDAKVWKFLSNILNDSFFKDDGYLNVGMNLLDTEGQQAFSIFVNTWPKYKKYLDDLHLSIERDEPDMAETIFTRDTFYSDLDKEF